MKSGRAYWLLAALACGVVHCGDGNPRDFKTGAAGEGGSDGRAGEAAGELGGSESALGGSEGTLGMAAAAGEGGAPIAAGGAPVLTTASLPDGKFNAPYAVQLEVEGSETLTFGISEGDLPAGLVLNEQGAIVGTPTEDGEFSFTVSVSNSAGEDSVELVLFVSRKPWLFYLANEAAEQQMTLYAIDTSAASLTKHVVSDGMPASASVSAFELSANGSRLAYTADVLTNDVLDLYVVALSRDAVGLPLRLETGGLPVGHFALTPSGEGIAYQVETAPDVWEYRFRDLTDPEAEVVTIGASMAAEPWHRMLWVTESRVVYSTDAGNGTRVHAGSTFSAESPLEAGWVTPYRERERAVTYSGSGTCRGVSWLYDFSGEEVKAHRAPATGNNFAVYSPDLSLLTLTDGAGGLFVHEATDTGAEPLGLISPTGFCSDVWWSPHGDRLVTTGFNYTSVQLTNIVDGALTTHIVEGDHTFNGTPAVAFIDNDRVLFTASSEILEFRIEDGLPSEASLLVDESPNLSTSNGWAFSVDRKWAYYVLSTSGGEQTPLLLDLGEPAPITPRLVRSALTTVVYSGSAFSPDSSALAVLQTGGNSGQQLYLTNLLHPTAQGTMVNVGGCNQWCAKVQSFQFQP